MDRRARRTGRRQPAPGSLGRAARWSLPLAIAGALLAVALLDREIGVARWWGLAHDLAEAEGRIEALRGELRALAIERVELSDDAFAIERAIREELELALPGETVVRTAPTASALAQVP